MKTKINEEGFIFYIERVQKICPHCESKEIYIKDKIIKKNICVIDVECVNCGREWSENYDYDFFKKLRLEKNESIY